MVGDQVSPTHRVDLTPPNVDRPNLLLQRDVHMPATWEVEVLGLLGRSERDHDVAGTDQLSSDITELLTGGEDPLIPRAYLDPPRALRNVMRGRLPQPKALTFGWNQIGKELLLTDAGLVERTYEGPHTAESTAPWNGIRRTTPTWVTEAMGPEGVVRSASVGDVEVVVLSVSTLTLVAICFGTDASWFTLHNSPDAILLPRASPHRWVWAQPRRSACGRIRERYAFRKSETERSNWRSRPLERSVTRNRRGCGIRCSLVWQAGVAAPVTPIAPVLLPGELRGAAVAAVPASCQRARRWSLGPPNDFASATAR